MKRQVYWPLCGLLALTLVGCASYTPLLIDERAILDKWREESKHSATTERHREAEYGIDFELATELASWLNPEMRVLRAKMGVAKAKADHAGRLDDPKLSLDAAKLLESAPEQWTYGLGVEWTLPVWGKAGIREDIAGALYSAEKFALAERSNQIFFEFWAKWKELDALREHANAVGARMESADTLLTVAANLNEAGELSNADYRHLKIQMAGLVEQQAELHAAIVKQERSILRLIGFTPESKIRLRGKAMRAADYDSLWKNDKGEKLPFQSYELHKLQAEYRAIEEEVRLEVRKQYPEIGLGPFFESEEGEESLGLGLSFSLPLFNRNVQGIETALAKRAAKRESFIARLKAMRWEYQESKQNAAQALARLNRIESDILPLIKEQVEELKRLAEQGTLDVQLVSDSNDQRLEVEVRRIRAQLELELAQLSMRRIGGPFGAEDWRIVEEIK